MRLVNRVPTFRTVAVSVPLLLIGMAWVSTSHAGEPPPPSRALYLKYCSACHGETGKGDGVVSGFMTPKPTDLTLIAKKAGGKFPFMEVLQQIDGTTAVRAHGDRDMPVWGESFRRELPDASLNRQARMRGRLMLLTEYVESLQQK